MASTINYTPPVPNPAIPSRRKTTNMRICEDYQLQLNEIPFEELCIRKETYSFVEVLDIKETEIIYSNSDDKESVVQITKEEYQEVLRILEESKLVTIEYEKDGLRYFID